MLPPGGILAVIGVVVDVNAECCNSTPKSLGGQGPTRHNVSLDTTSVPAK